MYSCKEIGQASSHGVVCERADRCGACAFVNVPYGEQLRDKDACIAELFRSVLGERGVLHPIIGMDDPFHYRNKVISPFAPGPKGTILTGMYAKGTHRLVKTDGCAVENVQANEVVAAIRRIMQKHHMEPYNEDTGHGFVRHVVVRVGHTSGEVLVTIVTNGEEFESSKAFCRALVKACPFITTIVQNINTRNTNVILGEKERTLYGPGFILDGLCGLSFRISSKSFYQVNAMQTQVLYELAAQFAMLDGTQTVIDAYCGTGTIGLVAAKRGAAHVIGVDNVESAIRDARLNAQHNGIQNAEFFTADATQFMQEHAAAGESVDVLLLDPPRAGSTPEFLSAAASCVPERIVYISCNPETQVRDIALLAECGYELRDVQPVDMFPHTEHVETVILMSKIGDQLPKTGMQ